MCSHMTTTNIRDVITNARACDDLAEQLELLAIQIRLAQKNHAPPSPTSMDLAERSTMSAVHAMTDIVMIGPKNRMWNIGSLRALTAARDYLLNGLAIYKKYSPEFDYVTTMAEYLEKQADMGDVKAVMATIMLSRQFGM